MRIYRKFFEVFISALFFALLVFVVPVYAEDEVYVGTLKPGQSISTRGISYAIYKISPTNIPKSDGWCPGCFNGGSCLSTATGNAAYSTYSVRVDGFSVFDYSSTSAGEGKIDLSQYSNCDAVLSMPSNYPVSQTVTCNGSSGCDPCRYSNTRTITVTGTLQLYSYNKKPKLVSNPIGVSSDTNGSAEFSVEGERTVAYQWQIDNGSGYTNLSDGTDPGGVVYSGTNTPTLHISNARYSLNRAHFRCVLIGEDGDEVYSDPAGIVVTDVTEPDVSISYSPTENAYDGVTILIRASDSDSGLCDKPYHYNGANHSENSFTVTSNGTYEIEVSDNAGNVAKKSITISNIRPRPTPTPTPTPSQSQNQTSYNSSGSTVPATSQTQLVPLNSVPLTTRTGNNTSTSVTTEKNNGNKQGNHDNEKDEDTNKTVEAKEKKVNVNNLSDKSKNKSEEKIKDKDYNLNLDMETDKDEDIISEDQNSEIRTASAPEENGNLEEVKNENNGYVIALSLGILLLMLSGIWAMIFPVRVESADELGTWHFCSLKMMSVKDGFIIKLGLLLEDFDRLRLHFGALFILLSKGKELTIMLDGTETIIVDEITQNMVVDYNQVRRS